MAIARALRRLSDSPAMKGIKTEAIGLGLAEPQRQRLSDSPAMKGIKTYIRDKS